MVLALRWDYRGCARSRRRWSSPRSSSCSRCSRSGPPSTAPGAGSRSARPSSSRRSSRSSRSRSGRRRTSRAGRRRGPSSELARPVGLLAGIYAVLLLARARPGHRDRPVLMLGAMLLVAGTPSTRPCARALVSRRRRHARDLGRALPPRALLLVPPPLARRAGLRLPDRPGDDRHGLGRHLRRRSRQRDREALLPARGTDGHDAREHRRGARPGRRHRSHPRLHRSSPGRASGSRSAAPIRSGSGSPWA